jgi:vacuolar-type H+-ATPase subunit I/STV1
MARWFRSEPMEYISLIVNEDAAHDCLADLGKSGVIQFTDVSSSYYHLQLSVTRSRVLSEFNSVFD